MGRLIDADALYKSFGATGNCNDCLLDAYKCQYYNEHTLMEFCERIDDAPTVDAVEVVRCKECIHYYADPWGYGNCVFEGGVSRRTKESDFCSWGETGVDGRDKMPRLIDADIAYKVLTDYYHIRMELQHKALKEAIERVPTADAEPVRYGRWQVNETNGHKDMTCLSCGWLFEYYDGLEEEWNYCPHCGALQSFAIATERREDATND